MAMASVKNFKEMLVNNLKIPFDDWQDIKGRFLMAILTNAM